MWFDFSADWLICNVFPAFTKICCRCGAEYKINVNGNCVRKEECGFHWGRLRRHKGTFVCSLVWMVNKHQYSECALVFLLFIQPNLNHSLSLHPSCSQLSFTSISFRLLSSLSVAGGWETIYSCCSGAVGSPGCQVAKVSFFSSQQLLTF